MSIEIYDPNNDPMHPEEFYELYLAAWRVSRIIEAINTNVDAATMRGHAVVMLRYYMMAICGFSKDALIKDLKTTKMLGGMTHDMTDKTNEFSYWPWINPPDDFREKFNKKFHKLLPTIEWE